MSFKNDYKSALRSAPPDTEKIISEVHQRLNENAPLKIRTEQKKKRPLWQIIAPLAGAAVCIALCIIFIPRFSGLPLNNAGEMNNAGDNNGAGNSPENVETNNSGNLNGGMDIAPENSSHVISDSSGSSWQSAEFEIIRGDDGDITEVVKDGTRYYRTDKVKANEISEKYESVLHVDKKSYYVILNGDDDVIYLVEDTSAWAYVFEKMSAYVNGHDLNNIDIMLITDANKETCVILEGDSYLQTGESFYLKTLSDNAARFISDGKKYLICGNGNRVMVVDTETHLAHYYIKESAVIQQFEEIKNESITVTQKQELFVKFQQKTAVLKSTAALF